MVILPANQRVLNQLFPLKEKRWKKKDEKYKGNKVLIDSLLCVSADVDIRIINSEFQRKN